MAADDIDHLDEQIDDLFAVELSSEEQVDYLMETLAGLGEPGMATGVNVAITFGGLAALSRLDSHADGHYDGTYLWIGGTEYEVTQ